MHTRSGIRGFSLVEMMVVIAVIALMIALLLPALSGAQDAALKTSTTAAQNDLSSAAQRFSNDNNGRMPGYFSEALMGHSDNLDVGMSAMENAMIELGGTGVILARADDPNAPNIDEDSGIVSVGPSRAIEDRVIVNVNLIGGEGAYYKPDARFLVAQDHEGGGQAGAPQGGQELMPDVLDAWGNPMLLWSQDTTARGSITVPAGADPDDVYSQFVSHTSDGMDPGNGPAWFYTASNEAFLNASAFGNAASAMNIASAIGANVDNDYDEFQRLRTISTLLASPSSYQLDPDVASLEDAAFEEIFPSVPRARFIVHSAGTDQIFVSPKEKGWLGNAHSDGGEFHMDFGNNYKDQTGARYLDVRDAFQNIDIADELDDQIAGAK